MQVLWIHDSNPLRFILGIIFQNCSSPNRSKHELLTLRLPKGMNHVVEEFSTLQENYSAWQVHNLVPAQLV